MNDFRYALRTLQRSPGLAAVAVTSLALGIGANTAIFSVANAVILRSLPVQKPNELVVLRYVTKKGNIFDSFSYLDYLALRDAPQVLQGLSATSSIEVNLASEEATERVPGQLVSGNYFPVLGVRPRIGRLIGPDDDRDAGGHPVCVISQGLWQRRFGSAPDVLGKKIEGVRPSHDGGASSFQTHESQSSAAVPGVGRLAPICRPATIRRNDHAGGDGAGRALRATSAGSSGLHI